MFTIKKESMLERFKSHFVTTSVRTKFLISGSICTRLRELYLCWKVSIDTEQWHASIGTFHIRIFFAKNKRTCCKPNHNFQMSIVVLKAGYIELTSVPNKKSHSCFFCCHLNVNSLPTDNYCKFAFLKAYNSIYKYDFIWS